MKVMNKLNFKQKLIAKFILFGIVIVSLSNIMLFEINKNFTVSDLVKKSQAKFKERETYLTTNLSQFSKLALSFNESIPFRNTIDNQSYAILENIFVSRIRSNSYIAQIRFLDLEGNEKVRVDKEDEKIKIVPSDKLQNKSSRYYFKEIINIEKGKTWYSKIDLNKEHGKIQKPIKPVIRVGTPIFSGGVKKGILIINVSMKTILDNLSKTTLYNIYLIDKDGYFILHKPNDYDKNDYSFDRYLNLNHKIVNHFPKTYKDILNNDIYEGKNFYSRTINRHYGEKLKLIVEVKQAVTENIFDKFKDNLLFVLLVSVLISIPFAFMIAQMVEDLRKDLENVLAKEKDKLKENELKLKKQEKLAHMGEMIGNIAHQWRQPLQSISGTAGSIKIQSEFGLLEDAELQDGMEQIEERTRYLSEVIDVFRNFVKEDKLLETVVIQDRIEDAIRIIGQDIETRQIKILKDIDSSNKLEIRLTKGELVQVIINILNNSKDVLIERNIEDAWIKISLSYTDKKAIIEVEDNGGGIPEDLLSKVFDPYFTTKHQSQGTGLGLHMSYDIVVNSLKGELVVENTVSGAKFIITIPISNPKV